MNVVQLPRRFVRSHWGGTETVILETSRRLLRLGHHTAIVCANALAERDAETLQGVPVQRYPYFYPYWGLRPQARRQLDLVGGSLFSFPMLRALARYPDLDLIHLHTGRRPGAIGRYVARQRRIPYVVSLHGGMFDVPPEVGAAGDHPTRGALEWGKLLGWWVGARRVLDDAAAILCVGLEEQRRVQQRFPDHRVLHLPNGVDGARFRDGDGARFRAAHGIPQAARVVLVVGRIDPQKNQSLALDLMPQLLQDVPDAHLLLVGHVTNEPYADALEARAAAAAWGRRVTMVRGVDGSGPDLVDAYHAADCFLLPSVHEPFGIVVLEAWAARRPVVASRVGGISDFVRDGRDGLLCAPQDGAGFRHAVRVVLTDAARAAALAEAGARRAQGEFDWDRITARLIGIYEDVRRAHPVRA